MRLFRTIPIGAALIVAACGSTAGTRPEDMTAAEHRREARRHDREGARAPYLRGSYLGGYYGDSSWGHPRGGSYWSHGYYPWSYYWSSRWDTGASHYAEAEEHEAAADVLEKRYRDTCALVAPNTAPIPPLDRFVRSVAPTDRGVILRLARDAGPPDMLLAEIQCHTAWLQLAPRPEAANDITAVKGIEYVVRAEADGITVTITAADPNGIAELRRRAERIAKPTSGAAVSSAGAR
jgi:hypothetical protein